MVVYHVARGIIAQVTVFVSSEFAERSSGRGFRPTSALRAASGAGNELAAPLRAIGPGRDEPPR